MSDTDMHIAEIRSNLGKQELALSDTWSTGQSTPDEDTNDLTLMNYSINNTAVVYRYKRKVHCPLHLDGHERSEGLGTHQGKYLHLVLRIHQR
jgi:hypothetical protein